MYQIWISIHWRVKVEQRHFRHAGSQKTDLPCTLPQDVPGKMKAQTRKRPRKQSFQQKKGEDIFRIVMKKILNLEQQAQEQLGSGWGERGGSGRGFPGR